MKKVGSFVFFVIFSILNSFCSKVLVKPKAIHFVPLGDIYIEENIESCPICESELKAFESSQSLYCPQCSSTLENILEKMFLNTFCDRTKYSQNSIVELICERTVERKNFFKKRWEELNCFLFDDCICPRMTCLFSLIKKNLNIANKEKHIEILTIFENSLAYALSKLTYLRKKDLTLFFTKINDTVQEKVLTQRGII